MMKRQIIATLLVGLAAACTDDDEQARAWARQAGSVALSADDRLLFVADADNDRLLMIDTAANEVKARVKVGRWPDRVVVAPDGRIFVSNRHDRSVSVIDPSTLEVTRVEVGVEPRGMAFSPDGRTLVVANSMSQDLSLVDVASLQVLTTVQTPGGEPRGVAMVSDSRVMVTYLRSDRISVLDLGTNALRTTMSLKLPAERTALERRLPGQATDPVFSADDGRVYVPHVQTKDDTIPTDVGPSGSAYAGGSSSGGGSVPVVANAIITVDIDNEAVLDAPGVSTNALGCFECDSSAIGSPRADVPAAIRFASGPEAGPVAAALAPGGDWLFVVNEFSNNVTLVSTRRQDVSLPAVKVGAGPNGIAIASTGDRAWVYNAFDHTVTVLAPSSGRVRAEHTFRVGESPLTPEQQLGRKLFFAADDKRLSNGSAGGISCGSCHPGGREDGRTWQFSEGPRNTPTLAGRRLSRSAPYHWDGLIEDMEGFRMVVEQRMGGSVHGNRLSVTDYNAMLAFLETLPAPDNPNRHPTPTPGQLRGQQLFEGSAQCVTCHLGPDFTDNGFHDVGTFVEVNENGNPDVFPLNGVNTPPLHNLFATAPYLHDGSAATLRDRVTFNPGDRHGTTSHLTPDEVDDLVAYLESL